MSDAPSRRLDPLRVMRDARKCRGMKPFLVSALNALVTLADNETRIVLLHVPGKGMIEPTIYQLAIEAHMSTGQLKESLAELEHGGWIRVEERRGRKGRIVVTAEHFCTDECQPRRGRTQPQRGQVPSHNVARFCGDQDAEPSHNVATTQPQRGYHPATTWPGASHTVAGSLFSLPDLPDLLPGSYPAACGGVARASAHAGEGPDVEPAPVTRPSPEEIPEGDKGGEEPEPESADPWGLRPVLARPASGDALEPAAPQVDARPPVETTPPSRQAPAGEAIATPDDLAPALSHPPGFLTVQEAAPARAAKRTGKHQEPAITKAPKQALPKPPSANERYRAAYVAGIADAAPGRTFSAPRTMGLEFIEALRAHALDAERRPLTGDALDAWIRETAAEFRRAKDGESDFWDGYHPGRKGFCKWLNAGRPGPRAGPQNKPYLKQPGNGMPVFYQQVTPEQEAKYGDDPFG
jgi:hypothetical protein